jgi:hypothetical protein
VRDEERLRGENMRIIPVEICLSGNLHDDDEERNVCHYGYWRLDSQNKRVIAVCDCEDKFIKILTDFPSGSFASDVEIPDWCPLPAAEPPREEGGEG